MTTELYVDAGYSDGYIWTPTGVVLTCGGTSINLYCPGRRSGSVRVLQPSEYSSGWARAVQASRMVQHTMNFEYAWMSEADKTLLEPYFGITDATALEWQYQDVNNAATVDCRFEQPEIAFSERRHGLFATSFSLLARETFFPLSTTVPTINDANTILTRLYYDYGLARRRKQPRLLFSDGSLAVYNKSAITRLYHNISLPYRTRAELASLIPFFTTACDGCRNTFSWTLDGAAKTVRFAEAELRWTQENRPDELYDVELTLEEEV